MSPTDPDPESGPGADVPVSGPTTGPTTGPTPGPTTGPDGGRGSLLTVAKVAFGVAVVGFGAAFVASRWDELVRALATTSVGWVVVSAVLAVGGQLCAALAFGSVLGSVSRTLPAEETSRVFFVSQLGKYIPGSVWSLVALTAMTRRHGISRTRALTGGLLALLVSVALGAVIGVVLVLASASDQVGGLWWLVLLLPVPVLLVRPAVVEWVIARVLRVLRRDPLDVTLRRAPLRRALAWQTGSWVLLGLHCWALVVALGGPVVASVVPAVGGFALAYSAGVLFIPAPAGAGVREAVLALALGSVVDGSSALTSATIIVVVLLSRVLLAFLDFALAGASSLPALTRVRRAARPTSGSQ